MECSMVHGIPHYMLSGTPCGMFQCVMWRKNGMCNTHGVVHVMSCGVVHVTRHDVCHVVCRVACSTLNGVLCGMQRGMMHAMWHNMWCDAS